VRRSVHDDEERLVLADDVRGEFGAGAVAGVADRVDGLGRDGQAVAGTDRDRRLAVEGVSSVPSRT
jgi:hypothetical protein